MKARVKGHSCSEPGCGGRRKQAKYAASAYDRLILTEVNLVAYSCNQMTDGMIYLLKLLTLDLVPPTYSWSAGELKTRFDLLVVDNFEMFNTRDGKVKGHQAILSWASSILRLVPKRCKIIYLNGNIQMFSKTAPHVKSSP